uniref:Yeast cell wall synthesis Kre9/Knh1-like N-terminal domain-containing protein n=1 Tax=Psilocybe cubensis TaxID=181762 RepID=A0A8H7Y6G6_PSICU
MFSFITFFTTLFFFAFVVQASPVDLVDRAKLDVFVPVILKPDSRTTWTIGRTAIVSWDTTNAPKSISNGASVYLNGYGTIASGFSLRDGNVTVTVPSVPQGPYFITLFGDSGNYSPVFTISN